MMRAAGAIDRPVGAHGEAGRRAEAPRLHRRSSSSRRRETDPVNQSVFTQIASDSRVVVYRRKATKDAPFVWLSESASHVLGFTNQSLITDEDRWKGLLHRDYHEQAQDLLKLVRSNDRHTWEYEILGADGEYRWIRDEMRLVRDDEGTPLEIVGCCLDLTPYKERRTGYGNHRARADFREIELAADLLVAQYRIRHQSVRHRDAVRALTHFTERLEASGARNFAIDPIDASVPVELFDRLPGAAYRTRPGDERIVEAVSPGFRDLIGLGDGPVDPAMRVSLRDLTHPDVRKSNTEQINSALASYKAYTLVYPIQLADGTERWILDQGHGFHSAERPGSEKPIDPLAIYGYMADVTDSLPTVDRLADPMGPEVIPESIHGVADNEQFERQVAGAIDSVRGAGADHVICILDIDAVTRRSDRTQGTDDIDPDAAAIISGPVGEALRQRVRSSDIVARLADNEFALLMPQCSLEKGEQVARELLVEISRLRVEHDDKTFAVDVQIGVAAVLGVCDSPSQMLDIARRASRMARTSTTDSVWAQESTAAKDEAVAEPAADNPGVESLELLDDKRLCLFAQPGFNARVREAPVFYELLLRYRLDEGLLLPEKFLPVAERYGLLARLDRWVIRNAVDIAAAGFTGRARAGISINLSSEAMNDLHFAEFVCEEMDRAGIEPGRLTFELAEMDAVDDLDQAAKFINNVKKYGCRFALDNFGAGAFSFSDLKQMPVDAVKISGALIRDAATSRVDRAMVEAIASVAREMGIKTVAKNVEDEDAAGVLCDLGVDYLQGYALQKPSAVPMLPK